jgi:hypothetical protein
VEGLGQPRVKLLFSHAAISSGVRLGRMPSYSLEMNSINARMFGTSIPPNG